MEKNSISIRDYIITELKDISMTESDIENAKNILRDVFSKIKTPADN